MTDSFPAPDRQGSAAGVPFLAFAPANPSSQSPLIVVLHLMDPPRSEAAMAAALPLDGVDAWRVYTGLPMFGSRAPEGGFAEILRLVNEEPLMNVMAPVIEQAAAELPAAVAALRSELQTRGPLVLIGGSAGGAAVLLSLIQGGVKPSAAVLLNPATQIRAVIEAGEEVFGMKYEWTDAANAKADELDFVRRAPELAAAGVPALLIVVGADDDLNTLPPASASLAAALPPENVDFISVEGLKHALAEEPGVEPAPQTAGAATVEAIVTEWLGKWLA